MRSGIKFSLKGFIECDRKDPDSFTKAMATVRGMERDLIDAHHDVDKCDMQVVSRKGE